MITKDIAVAAHHRDIFHHTTEKGSDKQPVRCRVNGKCKTWKTRPDDFRLPVKHGLRTYFYITPYNAPDWIATSVDGALLTKPENFISIPTSW